MITPELNHTKNHSVCSSLWITFSAGSPYALECQPIFPSFNHVHRSNAKACKSVFWFLICTVLVSFWCKELFVDLLRKECSLYRITLTSAWLDTFCRYRQNPQRNFTSDMFTKKMNLDALNLIISDESFLILLLLSKKLRKSCVKFYENRKVAFVQRIAFSNFPTSQRYLELNR